MSKATLVLKKGRKEELSFSATANLMSVAEKNPETVLGDNIHIE